jgi:predicted RNase H-like nuclease (RuvC/YqgF family)
MDIKYQVNKLTKYVLQLQVDNNIMQNEIKKLHLENNKVNQLEKELFELRKEVAENRDKIQYLLDIDYLHSTYSKGKGQVEPH